MAWKPQQVTQSMGQRASLMAQQNGRPGKWGDRPHCPTCVSYIFGYQLDQRTVFNNRRTIFQGNRKRTAYQVRPQLSEQDGRPFDRADSAQADSAAKYDPVLASGSTGAPGAALPGVPAECPIFPFIRVNRALNPVRRFLRTGLKLELLQHCELSVVGGKAIYQNVFASGISSYFKLFSLITVIYAVLLTHAVYLPLQQLAVTLVTLPAFN
eukprot:369503-Amphidinium_carterae.1